ncbi:MAG: hypothetical protein PHE50_08335, partial [Dehalococcoidales bacterium]|nr:hypothetical protein [Dehalococcoidales bacterium]
MLAVIEGFQSLSPKDRIRFTVGRRAGVFECLDDLNDALRRERVDQIVERLSGGTGKVDEELVHKLRLAYT